MSALAQIAPPAVALRIEAEGLAHRYAPGRGLDPVSFTVGAPGAVAITGPNGSGKSTLLRAIAGLLRPTAGRLRVTVGVTELLPAVRRMRFGYLSPELSFYEEMTAGENLAFAAEARGAETTEAAETVREALAQVGLAARQGDRVAVLSSGMKQRLRVAFALLGRPDALLLDEPGSHLDEAGREMLEALVREHARSSLVLIATNDPREWTLAGERIDLRGRGLGHPA